MPRPYISVGTQRAVIERAQGRCEYCQSEDYSHIIALTPTGRATLEALQLNRRGLVNMRKVLYVIGKHPP